MKKAIVIFAILTSINAFGQSKNRKSINVGLSKIDLYSKPFLFDKGCIEGCYVTEQNARTFFDLNFFYELSIGKKFFIQLGLGVNEKGFLEKGFSNDGGGNWIPYSEVYSRTCGGLYGGISYDVIVSKIVTINIAQLINPELIADYKRYHTTP